MQSMTNTPAICAAVLFRAGENHADENDIWAKCKKATDVIDLPDDRVLIADNWEEIETRILEMHPAAPGCTFVEYHHSHDIRFPYPKEKNWRRRNDYDHRYVDGWMISKYPIFTGDPDTRAELFTACNDHGCVLISTHAFRNLGGSEAFQQDGFTVTTSHGHIKLRWNNKNAALQLWRKKLAETQKLLVDELPGDIFHRLGECVNPKNWPSDHPYANIVQADKDYSPPETPEQARKRRHGGWQYRHHEPNHYQAWHILTFVKLSKKLWPGHHPWREHGNYDYSFKKVMEKAVLYIHGLRTSSNEKTRELAKWLTNEARALKIKIPPKPELPAKPSFRSKKKRRNKACKQPQKQPNQPTSGQGFDATSPAASGAERPCGPSDSSGNTSGTCPLPTAASAIPDTTEPSSDSARQPAVCCT